MLWNSVPWAKSLEVLLVGVWINRHRLTWVFCFIFPMVILNTLFRLLLFLKCFSCCHSLSFVTYLLPLVSPFFFTLVIFSLSSNFLGFVIECSFLWSLELSLDMLHLSLWCWILDGLIRGSLKNWTRTWEWVNTLWEWNTSGIECKHVRSGETHLII